MISVDLATELRAAGLSWRPEWGDRFHIPDRHLDDESFLIADLSVYVTTLADGLGAISFNGTSEWAMDYILTHEVIWLPTETQLRSRLSDGFRRLEPTSSGFRCTVDLDGQDRSFEGPTAADAYGKALLETLRV
jgi:hypothetical protein